MAQSPAAWVRHLRLWSGIVLFTYLTTHFTNHALGLISLDAMEQGRTWFLALWRNPVSSILFRASLWTHFALALWSLYRRPHLRMPAWEAVQLVLGLAIPPLLASHIVGTRLASDWFGATDSYTVTVIVIWKLKPALALKQVIVLTIAWLHGCVGLHFWLRLKPRYSRVAPILFGFALMLPVLGLLGFSQAGREVSRLAQQPGWTQAALQAANAPSPSELAKLARVTNAIIGGFTGSVLLTLLAHTLRRISQRRKAIRITYTHGQEIRVPSGFSVLEASRLAGIPHASVCGGRGRCTTCRVRVVKDLELLPSARPEELRVLRRIGAPPNVRLACQLRPKRDVSVTLLLPASAQASDGFARAGHLVGQEKEIAVLFADLRGFTKLAEHKLPYDVVFFLNRYFEVAGSAIERFGGIANQFTGDGVMALFGVDSGPETGCRQALAAAGEMAGTLSELSRSMAEELDEPLRMNIGIHFGPAVVGNMGRGVARYLTAVSDTVHVASRLQDLTKEYECQMVISESVAERADIEVSAFARHELTVRNRRESIAIRTIHDIQALNLPSSGLRVS